MDQMQPTGPAAQPSAPTEEAGYTICITVGGDGALSVSVESEAQEQAESLGGGTEEPVMETSQPAANIKEALTMALAAYKDNGKLPDMQGQTDQFEQGFGSVSAGRAGQ